MFRLAYRTFGNHSSVVGNFTVSSNGVAGIRWFELRGVIAGPLTTFQESTYQPDTTWRFQGSIAMDQQGNMALGYSASDATIFPQIRYTGRLATDPLNSMPQGEAHLFDGTGAQSDTSNRWGDYSDMTIDPVDDCTFWYTTEYYDTTSSFNWRTRIGNFKFAQCGSSSMLWYNGDFDGVNGLGNEQDTSLGAGQFAHIYDDFDVTDPNGWNVTSVYSDNLVSTNITGATWEIRQGISEGNGGSLIASGMTLTPTVTATGRSGMGLNEFQVEVTGLSVHLDLGSYFLNVTPIGDLTGRSFDSTTSGANCISTPCGNNQNAFFDSNFFGAVFTSTANFGQPNDYSMGVNGTPVTPPPPVITSPPTDTATVGQPYNYQITATNNPTGFGATGLPANLTVNDATGLISGTPLAEGISSITLSASNAGGTGTAPLTLTVNPPPPVITSPLTATATVGQLFNYQITATNSPTSFNATGLPAGLTVDTGTGLITGTPSAVGMSSVTLSATNAGGTGTATLTLTVNPPPPVITSPLTATATVGQLFNYQITATNSPTSFNATGLPTGLTVDTGTGLITGTPSVVGMSSVTLSATNAGGTGTAVLALTTNLAPPVITSSLSPTGTVGQSFSYQITATNSPTSYGATGLPAPLTVNTSTGLISGTPSAAGTFPITLSATNSGGTGSATATLTIAGPSAPVFFSPTSATATVGLDFSYQPEATGALTFSVDESTLPPGLTFNPTIVALVGKPTTDGLFHITLMASNLDGMTPATLDLTVQKAPASGPVIISLTSVKGRTGIPFSFQVLTRGGTSAQQLTVDSLPQGLSADPVSGEISGIPEMDGSSLVFLDVTDGNDTTSATLQLTFTSDPSVPVILNSTNAFLVSGEFFSYTLIASSGDGTTFFPIPDLPTGLGLNSDTGEISGTPQFAFRAQPVPQLAGGIISNVAIATCGPGGCSYAPFNFYTPPSNALNISTRLAVGTGDDVIIAGFIIKPAASSASPPGMKVVLRAIGPSLTQLGVPGVLLNPYIELHNSTPNSPAIATNDDWQVDNKTGMSQATPIFLTGLAPGDPLTPQPPLHPQPLESAILANLDPGTTASPAPYTAIVSGKGQTTGIGAVEAYNLGTYSFVDGLETDFVNISTRGKVQPGDKVMIGGFITKKATKVVLRAIGPSLSSAGIVNFLADPVLELHDGAGNLITSNDNWRDTQEAAIMATTIAPKDDNESAILMTALPAGWYTAIVKGKNNATGVALVEAFFLP